MGDNTYLKAPKRNLLVRRSRRETSEDWKPSGVCDLTMLGVMFLGTVCPW